jgi:hypothetical protein
MLLTLLASKRFLISFKCLRKLSALFKTFSREYRSVIDDCCMMAIDETVKLDDRKIAVKAE